MSDEQARIADELAAKIHRLLAGKGPEVQGAAIADLTAIWLHGHLVLGDPAATDKIRREIFEHQCQLIWQLVEHYDQRRGT